MENVTIRTGELKPYCAGCIHFEPLKFGPEDAPIEECMIDCAHYELCADLFDRIKDMKPCDCAGKPKTEINLHSMSADELYQALLKHEQRLAHSIIHII